MNSLCYLTLIFTDYLLKTVSPTIPSTTQTSTTIAIAHLESAISSHDL